MQKIILTLTHGRDDCADLVLQQFTNAGVDFIRFNTEEFHSSVKLTVTLASRGQCEGRLQFPDRSVSFEDVGVVWNRRVHDPEISHELDHEPELRDWMLQETKWAFSAAMTLFTCPVVNPWEVNERLKYNKLLQMRIAADVGFEIPDTMMTDEPDRIRAFWQDVGREVIMKKIRKGILQLKDGRRVLFHTTRIPPDAQNETSIRRMRFAPAFLQAHVAKKYDIRSIVVGEQVFSVAIHSQGLPEGVVDYRSAAVLGKLKEMHHEPVDLGEEVNRRMIEFSRRFGLTFGALDFIETPDGRLVFLEDNPNGQWAWLEHLTGLPIARAIAEHLLQIRE